MIKLSYQWQVLRMPETETSCVNDCGIFLERKQKLLSLIITHHASYRTAAIITEPNLSG